MDQKTNHKCTELGQKLGKIRPDKTRPKLDKTRLNWIKLVHTDQEVTKFNQNRTIINSVQK